MENKSGGFHTEAFKNLFEAEEKSFWFTNRNNLIIYFLKKYFPDMKNYLEIGCGTGFVLNAVSKAFPECSVTGSELFEEGLNYAKERVPNAKLIQLDASKLVEKNVYDVFGAYDVLEHIPDDEKVMENLNFTLKNNTIQKISRMGGGNNCTSTYVHVERIGRLGLSLPTILTKRVALKA